jgi:hypothetical protein
MTRLGMELAYGILVLASVLYVLASYFPEQIAAILR